MARVPTVARSVNFAIRIWGLGKFFNFSLVCSFAPVVYSK